LKIIFAIDKTRFFYINELGGELKKYGIEYFLIDDLSIYDKSLWSNKILKWTRKPKKFFKIINKTKPDLVFTERTSHFASLIIDEKIPLIIFMRGNIWEESKWEIKNNSLNNKIQQKFKEKIRDKCFNQAKIILPICNYLSEITKNKYPDKKKKRMYQGINPERWYTSKGMQLKHPCVGLLQAANLWGKAQEMLILKKVLKKMPNVTFYWAGDGPHREKINNELKEYENFKWLGNLQYPDKVREYLSEIDIYALITGLDMAPHTILEAQLMKKPVIATNIGGIPELMKNNETGFLVEKGDTKELIEKISFLINNKEKREEMGNAGRKFIENNFTWEKIAEEFVNILKREKLFKE
jgi:glycosyltransferase involved in cell wall biosynthesis